MRTLLAFLLLTFQLLASTYTVDATGGGDFVDLQVAIDTVAPGDTLVIVGKQNDGYPYTVTKSLTLKGGKGGTIQGHAYHYEDSTGLVIDAGANATVILLGLTIAGGGNEGGHSSDGLRILSAKRVRVDTCAVLGGLGDSIESSGDTWGEERSADGIDVRSCGEIIVFESLVVAGLGPTLITGGDNGINYSADGGHGINLAGGWGTTGAGKAILMRSTFIGGDGAPLQWDRGGYAPNRDDTVYGSDGGAGVFARGKVIDLGCTFSGGLKGDLYVSMHPPSPWIPGRDGRPLDLGNQR
jgi:hypothetical protein